MTTSEIEYTFYSFGYGALYHKFRYPLLVSEHLKHVDADVLEAFFTWYTFDDTKKLLFDDFIYHFRLFENICKNNSLPSSL
ncbi:hypothetical protein SAMN05192534_10816 [Alteribacillus persepolensis]|uniref:Uncharacterized protein n=1 Tax=Alteribacillus persepolensis TaxID=568899 RepID=A0A1G8DT91_9BACI|nr:hypothetical protein [Alteribacillus persepolensis]SDH60818.1 hypothetical protein SAMN05192534_10816 [Alteribacillus persepolensis]